MALGFDCGYIWRENVEERVLLLSATNRALFLLSHLTCFIRELRSQLGRKSAKLPFDLRV